MSYTYNSNGVVKATVQTAKPSGCGGRGKVCTLNGRLQLIEASGEKGTIKRGVGTALGMLAVTAGPAPVGAVRRWGRAFVNGTLYYVTSGTRARTIEKLSFTANGDLLVDTT